MKPYRTSFLRMAAFVMLLCSLTSIHSQSAKAADCGFTISTTDTAWSFSAAAGSTQSRTLTITNTSGTELTLVISTGSDAFSVEHSQITIPKGDSNLWTSITITFKPGVHASGNLYGNLKITKLNTDCSKSLGLVGTVTTGNNGGGDKIVRIEPNGYVFGPVHVGTDSCHGFYLTNSTGASVTITQMLLLSSSDFTLDPAFNGVTIDSGGVYRFSVCFKGDPNHVKVVDSLLVTYTSGGAVHYAVVELAGYTAVTTPPVVLVADPHEFSFGTVEFGTTACKDVVVTNKSKSLVIVSSWGLCDNKDFSVTPGFNHSDSLAAGSSMTFHICYMPHEANLQASCYLSLKYITVDPSGDGSLVINFGGNSVTDSNIIHTPVCLKTEQGSNYHDAIVIGGTAEHTLYLINNTYQDIKITSATISGTDAGVFSITTQLPINVSPQTSTTTLEYKFAPTSSTKTEFSAIATLSLSGDSLTCKSVDAHLIGYIVHGTNTTDSTVRPLFPAEHRTLGIEGSANRQASVSFYFTNNLTVDCTVNKIYLADGTYFTISSTNPTPAPFVLHPGDNLTVVITYTATDNAVHHDHLMIDANHNLQAQDFDLQGLNLAASVPNALPTGVAINVSPNPASSYVLVNMAGIRSADIQVIDLLGNIQTSAKANTTWKWDASNFVSGSYIVRIAGTSVTGEQFVASKRIIVSK